MKIIGLVIISFLLSVCTFSIINGESIGNTEISKTIMKNMNVSVDPETGCEYINYTTSTGIKTFSIRYDSNGKPKCGIENINQVQK